MATEKTAIEKLREKIKEVAEGQAVGMETFRLGYIPELATGQTDYPAMLLLPPDSQVKNTRVWESREWDLRYFLMVLDQGATGNRMTEEERAAAWGRLNAANKAIISALTSSPYYYQVVGEISERYDSGGGDNLMVDMVVWLEVSYKLKTGDC